MITKSSKYKLADMIYDITQSMVNHNSGDLKSIALRLNTSVGLSRYMLVNKFILQEDFNKIKDIETQFKKTYIKEMKEDNKMKTKTRKPTHPGILFYEDYMKPLKLSERDTAKKLKIDVYALVFFCRGDTPLTSSLCKKIAKLTKTSEESWKNLQYNLWNWEFENGGNK